jgi:hypothetical protein
MPNMSYCRFTNTLGDLKDCEEHMDDNDDDLSDGEIKARKRLIDLCKRIADAYAEDDD